MRQGHNLGVQSSESVDITVWIISCISMHDYVLSVEVKFFLYSKFGCKNWGSLFRELDKSKETRSRSKWIQ